EALSRRRAVMLQRTALQADWTVETVIAMGRSPWGATADPAVLVAVAVAISGVIGFIGLVVPHLMRLWLGPDHRGLIPGSLL
ncbi:iron chelate uptake ABC transporter family permease subunit, partial [Klebsiella pneumoniae]|uniref:iron chelate uptake ABC transporter family permease subunit n=1 Tax=Klebsiella pneumoniae TaxID=573 RepID=UPI00214C06B9